jgi:rhodanese-related sulfurtransferase
MRPIFVALLLVIATTIFYYLYDYAVNGRWRISAAEARRRISRGEFAVILDVRTAVERATLGYYPNSVHIPAADLESKLEKLYPNKELPILIYCNTGHRARLAADKLHALGYVNARYISSPHTSLLA